MCQGIEDTLFGCDVVIVVPMEVLVCVGGYSIHCGAKGVVWLYGD